MQLSVGEDLDLWQERAVWSIERVREEEAENESTKTGESAHKHEQPEPASTSSNSSHVEDTVCKEFCRCLAKLVAEVKDHHTLRGFLLGVPGRQRPESAGDEA